MFLISKEWKFEAAHFLPHHDGKCRRMHGHSYRVAVRLRAHDLEAKGPKEGMVLDFGDLNEIVKPVIDALDHQTLNFVLAEVFGLAGDAPPVPTAENLARWFGRHVRAALRDRNAHAARAVAVDRVRVYETATSYAEWRPE